MYPCCAYDPGLFLFTMGEDEIEPSPGHDRPTLAVAIVAWVVVISLLVQVS